MAADAPRSDLIAAAVQRPVTVLVGVVLIVMFGALSVVGLPIQLTPDISVPTMTVTTAWAGASPRETSARSTRLRHGCAVDLSWRGWSM